MRLLRCVFLGLGALTLTLVLASPASAHPMPSSIVRLDVYDDHVEARLEIPLSELALALNEDLLDDADVVSNHGAALAAYLAQHVRPTAGSGDPWTVDVDTLSVSDAEQTASGAYRELVATLTLTPPGNASVTRFVLSYDVVIHQVVTHTILVAVYDHSPGSSGSTAVQVASITINPIDGSIPDLTVDATQTDRWSGFVSMLKLGIDHIRQGADHQLFLLTLLLPAPLLARGARWREAADPHTAIRRIVAITTAFTIGHSATLILATTTHWHVNARPVEALIAVSIILSSLHAIRPLFPGREVVVAGSFGLIHGMAFAFTLSRLDLDAVQTAISLLGFNLGIEIMQLMVIALTMPSLLVIARTSLYPWIRLGGATVALVAAVGWLLDRLGHANPVAHAANGWSTHLLWPVCALAVIALFRRAPRWRHPPPSNPRSQGASELDAANSEADLASTMR